MPEMDGLTVLKEIRAYDPHAPVIILGGGATEEQENQARGLRVTDFIRKGLSLDVLVECVNRVVQLPAKSVPVLPVAGSVAAADTEKRSSSLMMSRWSATCLYSFSVSAVIGYSA